MKKFALAVLLVGATAAFAIQQLDIDLSTRLNAFISGILITPKSLNISDARINANRITRALGASATVDFTSASVGSALSSSISVPGARAGDPCFVGVTTAAAALGADFECFVDAADSVKIQFAPRSVQAGAVALTSASPSTATVTSITAGSTCYCSPVGTTAAIAAAGCAASLSSTTLTLTGPNTVTTTMAYTCVAPVDPASGTFYVRVLSAQ